MQRRGNTVSRDLNFFWLHKTKPITVIRPSLEILSPCVLALTKFSWRSSHSLCWRNLTMHTDSECYVRMRTHTPTPPFLTEPRRGQNAAATLQTSRLRRGWEGPSANLLKAFLSSIQSVSYSKEQSRKAPTWQLIERLWEWLNKKWTKWKRNEQIHTHTPLTQ